MLNQTLADSLDLYSHAKQAHWNIRGAQFLSLHELLDQIAAAALKSADEVAERAGQLGSAVHGTLADGAKSSSLPRYELTLGTCEQHTQAVVRSLALFCDHVRKGISEADDAGDPITADILTTTGRELEKQLWLLESHFSLVHPPSIVKKIGKSTKRS